MSTRISLSQTASFTQSEPVLRFRCLLACDTASLNKLRISQRVLGFPHVRADGSTRSKELFADDPSQRILRKLPHKFQYPQRKLKCALREVSLYSRSAHARYLTSYYAKYNSRFDVLTF
jgi:hypothetical protein